MKRNKNNAYRNWNDRRLNKVWQDYYKELYQYNHNKQPEKIKKLSKKGVYL